MCGGWWVVVGDGVVVCDGRWVVVVGDGVVVWWCAVGGGW